MKALRPFTLLFVMASLLGVSAWRESGEGLTGGASGTLTQVRDSDLKSKKIVPFVPTPQEVVERMLQLAEVKKGDVIYDLGSGDGRIVITAAKKYGVKAVGFEIDPDLVKRSREKIQKAGVSNLAEIRQQDILTVDLSPASVLTMYLLPDVNLKLRPNIRKQLKPGSRVVSHDFNMGDWKPVKVEHIQDNSNWNHTLYLWRIEAGANYRDYR